MLFVLLFAWIAFSFMSAIAGFVVLLFRSKDKLGIDPDGPAGDREPDRIVAADL